MNAMKSESVCRPMNQPFKAKPLAGGRIRSSLPRRKASDLIDVDIRGLGRKLCEILGVLSGDVLEFHVLGDGSVRVINYGNK